MILDVYVSVSLSPWMLNILMLLWFIKIRPTLPETNIARETLGLEDEASCQVLCYIISLGVYTWISCRLIMLGSIVRFLRLSSQSIVIWCKLDHLSLNFLLKGLNHKDFHLATNHPTIGVKRCICYWGGKGCSHPQWRMGWNWRRSMRGHHRQPGFVRVLLIGPRNLSNCEVL